MKLSVQYVNDSNGKVQAVQLSLNEWEKVLLKMKEYESILKIKSDLSEAFSEVKQMQAGKVKKETLSEFLHGL